MLMFSLMYDVSARVVLSSVYQVLLLFFQNKNKQTVNPRQLSSTSSSKRKRGNHDGPCSEQTRRDPGCIFQTGASLHPLLTFTAPAHSQSKLTSSAL